MGHGWLWWLSFHGRSPWPCWALQKWKGLHLGNLKLGGYEEFSSSNPAPHLSAELSIHVFGLNKRLLSSLCRPTATSVRVPQTLLSKPHLPQSFGALNHMVSVYGALVALWRLQGQSSFTSPVPSSVPDPWWVPSTGLGCEWVVWGPRSKLSWSSITGFPVLSCSCQNHQQSYLIWVCHVTWHVGVISHRHIIYYPSSAVEETETERLQSHS